MVKYLDNLGLFLLISPPIINSIDFIEIIDHPNPDYIGIYYRHSDDINNKPAFWSCFDAWIYFFDGGPVQPELDSWSINIYDVGDGEQDLYGGGYI